jgi:hypothetical protein
MPTLLRLYVECLARTGRALGRSPWTLLLPLGYGAAAGVATAIAAPLGIIGGFLVGLVQAALAASFLYVLDELVTGNPVRPRELAASVRRYLWPVVNVLFVLWLLQLLVGPLVRELERGPVIMFLIGLALFVLLNAAPEAIYRKGTHDGLETIAASVRFIQTNWIEWFIPNLAFGAALYLGLPRLFDALARPLSLVGPLVSSLVFGLVTGALLLPVMVFRGHLFQALDSTTARQRRLRYRGGLG